MHNQAHVCHELDGQTYNETRAERIRGDVSIGRTDVFGPDDAAMCFDNLL